MLQALLLSAAANGVGAWAATVFAFWNGHYFIFGSAFALTLGLILLVPLVLIAMARIEEIAAVAFGRGPHRLISKPRDGGARHHGRGPHLPEGLDPRARLFRAAGDAQGRRSMRCRGSTIRISNASSSSTTRPIRRSGSRSRITAATLGERFKFINAEKVQGLQGRRAAHRHGAHRCRCRDHRHHRCRLLRRAGLAEGPRACLRRSRASASCRRRRTIATRTAR